MKKPLAVALIAFVCLLFLFVKKTSGFTPSPFLPKPAPSPSPKPAPSPSPKPSPEDDQDEEDPVERDIIYKGACNWSKFPTSGCDPSRGWCKKDNNMCTTDFTASPTYGKFAGLCLTDEDCDTSGAECILTPPQTLYGKCSK